MKLDSTRAILGSTLLILAVAPQDALAQISKGKAQSAPVMPIRIGFYAEAPNSCAASLKNDTGMFVHARAFQHFEVVIDVVRVSRRSSREYDLIESTEGEDGSFHKEKTKVRILSPSSFIRVHPDHRVEKSPIISSTYRFCSANLPKAWR